MDITRKRPRRLWKAAAAVIALSALIAVAVTVWRSSASTAGPTADRASVWTEKVHRGALVRQVAAQGTLVPEHVQWLSAPTAARVAHIELRAGAAVTPDTVVLTLENPELELATLDAERQAASAESALIQLDVRTGAEQKLQQSSLADLRAQLRDAERHAMASNQLAMEGLVSDLDHGDAQNKAAGLLERVHTEEGREQVLGAGRGKQLEAQRAEVARLREIATFRHRQLSALQVRAGIQGVVEDVPLENGQWVAVGALLAKVAEPEKLKAEMRVSEADAKEIHKGLGVRFEVPVAGLRGHVDRVDPTVVAGSVRLQVVLDGPLPPGSRADQTVSGYVEIETLPDVLYVARPAGARETSTASLFRFEADGVHADRVPVKLGRGSARDIEILGGLSDGDNVIVSDTSTWDTASRIAIK